MRANVTGHCYGGDKLVGRARGGWVLGRIGAGACRWLVEGWVRAGGGGQVLLQVSGTGGWSSGRSGGMSSKVGRQMGWYGPIDVNIHTFIIRMKNSSRGLVWVNKC